MKRETIEKKLSGKSYFVYPEHVKRQIVTELENGSLSIKEVMVRYEIQRAGTIYEWLKRYSEQYREKDMRVLLPLSERRQIAYKVDSGVLSLEVASNRYRVSQDTIKKWIKLYTCTPKLVDIMAQNEEAQQSSTQETKALQKQVEMLKLKVEALETLIDIAEKNMKIDIRKKTGTKQ